MKHIAILATVCVAASLSGCASWSTGDVQPAGGVSAQGTKARVPKSASQIIVTESDITNRKYRVVGDISVTVNKTTIFHPNPTREKVEGKLRERAAQLGADAIVLVRYGTVGITPLSWGSLSGKGRAVAFEN